MCIINGRRLSIFDIRKYVLDNIDKDIESIEYNLESEGKDVDENELDILLSDFKTKLEDISPNCRVDKIRKKVEKESMILYTRGKHDKTDKNEIKISIKLSDLKGTRYINNYLK